MAKQFPLAQHGCETSPSVKATLRQNWALHTYRCGSLQKVKQLLKSHEWFCDYRMLVNMGITHINHGPT